MPYRLPDKRILSDSKAFNLNDVHYPSNWLRLSTEEDRAALGITWVDSEPTYDQRFYWGFDENNQLRPKDYADLAGLYAEQARHSANSLLSPSDWRVIKAKERGTTLNADWKTWRQVIRTECGEKISAIEETANEADAAPYADLNRVNALKAYVEGEDYPSWTADPDSTEAL